MSKPHNVAVLVGSLRKDSVSLMLSKALMECAPPNLKLTHVEIGKLPLYIIQMKTSVPHLHGLNFVRDKYQRRPSVCNTRI